MSLTIADVVLRVFHKPIVGTYELVALSGAVVIGFSMPHTVLAQGPHLCGFSHCAISPGR